MASMPSPSPAHKIIECVLSRPPPTPPPPPHHEAPSCHATFLPPPIHTCAVKTGSSLPYKICVRDTWGHRKQKYTMLTSRTKKRAHTGKNNYSKAERVQRDNLTENAVMIINSASLLMKNRMILVGRVQASYAVI